MAIDIKKLNASWKALPLEMLKTIALEPDAWKAIQAAQRHMSASRFVSLMPLRVAEIKSSIHSEFLKMSSLSTEASRLSKFVSVFKKSFSEDINKMNAFLFGTASKNPFIRTTCSFDLSGGNQKTNIHTTKTKGRLSPVYMMSLLANPLWYIPEKYKLSECQKIQTLIELAKSDTAEGEKIRQELRQDCILNPMMPGYVGIVIGSNKPRHRAATLHCAAPLFGHHSAFFQSIGLPPIPQKRKNRANSASRQHP